MKNQSVLGLQENIMKFLLTSGEYYGDKGLDFPVAQELASSKLLVVCKRGEENIVAACGVRSSLNILVLHVKEGYRGQGIGKQLLMETIKAAEKRQLGFLTLTVSSDNVVAFNLYRKFGFKEVIFLRKSRQVLMMLPLTLVGKLTCSFFRALSLLLPNTFWWHAHSCLYKRTLPRATLEEKTET